jgi:hypothetical protein
LSKAKSVSVVFDRFVCVLRKEVAIFWRNPNQEKNGLSTLPRSYLEKEIYIFIRGIVNNQQLERTRLHFKPTPKNAPANQPTSERERGKIRLVF